MGVLPCSRKECPKIMCDRYSYTHGYICQECFEELKRAGYASHREIAAFLETPKRVNDSKCLDIEEEFKLR